MFVNLASVKEATAPETLTALFPVEIGTGATRVATLPALRAAVLDGGEDSDFRVVGEKQYMWDYGTSNWRRVTLVNGAFTVGENL